MEVSLFRTQLERAHVCRSTQSWKLYEASEWLRFKEPKQVLDSLQSTEKALFMQDLGLDTRDQPRCSLLGIGFEDQRESIENFYSFYNKNLENHFPGVKELLERFQGKLALCGGFFSAANYTTDVDLFFYDCTPEEAQFIIEEACRMIPNLIREKLQILDEDDGLRDYYSGMRTEFSRCQETSNIYFRRTDRYWTHDTKIQFIHRIYPSLAHIIGGFDVQASMIAMDGDKIVSNCLGAWAFINSVIVADISRCSPSFGHRLGKYRRRGYNIIFPGFDKTTKTYLVDELNEKEKRVKEEINELIKNHGLRFKGWDYDYGYHFDSSSSNDAPDLEPEEETQSVEIMHGMWLKLTKQDRGDVVSRSCPPQVQDYGAIIAVSFYGADQDCLAECNLACLISGRVKGFSTKLVKLECEQSPSWSIIEDGLLFCEEEDYMEAFYAMTRRDPFYRTANLVSLFGGYENIPLEYRNEYIMEKHDLKSFEKSPRDLEYKILYHRSTRAEIIQDYLFDKLFVHREEFEKSLTKMVWMTQNPQLQWTSTIHPELLTAEEFYKGSWNGFTIFPWEIIRLFLISRNEPGSAFFAFPKDLIKLILWKIPFLEEEKSQLMDEEEEAS